MNGDPCRSPALLDKRFCYYHEHAGPPPTNINNTESNPSFHVYLPQLGDAVSIQSAISEVCEMMLHRRIEPKEASALFYAMQVASSNLDHLPAARNQTLHSETSSDPSAPKPLPPGTIQACEQPRSRNPI
jgi:hypothetical protein